MHLSRGMGPEHDGSRTMVTLNLESAQVQRLRGLAQVSRWGRMGDLFSDMEWMQHKYKKS